MRSSCCLFLDNRHRILAFEEMFRGTLNGTAVYPREIVKRALALNAAALILVHHFANGHTCDIRPSGIGRLKGQDYGRLRGASEMAVNR